MIPHAIYTITVIFFILSFVNAYKVNSSLMWLKRLKQQYGRGDTTSSFLLLFPVLNEQSRIKEAIGSLRLIDYPKSQLRIIFISTAKEMKYEGVPSTAEIIEQSTDMPTNAMHLHYPYTSGVKADQLNWAIMELEKHDLLDPDSLIGIYDIDSALQPHTLRVVSMAATITQANVLQQPSLYFKNWQSISPSARSSALYQTVYGCFYEINTWRKWTSRLPPMRYCNGHGMFVRACFLKNAGYFPSPLEDTRFGHICAFINEPISVVPVFDDCETTNRTMSRIKQASVWFSGDVQYVQALSVARDIRGVAVAFALWLMINKTYRTVVWMLQGFIVVGSLVIGIIASYPFLVLAVLLHAYLPAAVLLRHISVLSELSGNKKPLAGKVTAHLLLPFSALLKSLGPWYAVHRYIKSKVRNTEFLYPKTENH